MALTTQSANLVRQRTYMITLSPGIFYGLKAIFLHLAANRGNPDLQYVPIDGTYSSSDGGANASQVLANVACHLYVIYGKKLGTIVNWLKFTDNATTATTNGGADISFAITNLTTASSAADDFLWVWPQGHTFLNGITMTENTTATGSTLTLKANRVDGFVIISA